MTLDLPGGDRNPELVLAMDRKYWREDRSLMLSRMLTNRSYVFNEDAWLGFKQVDDHWTIGPWEATDKDSALDLLKGVIVDGNNQRILLDVPAQNTRAWDILTIMDFEVVGKTVLMCRGLLPDIAFGNIYGLASMGSKG